MGDSEVGAKHMQDKSGSTCHVRKQEVHKRKKKMEGGMSEGRRSQPKRAPNEQS